MVSMTFSHPNHRVRSYHQNINCSTIIQLLTKKTNMSNYFKKELHCHFYSDNITTSLTTKEIEMKHLRLIANNGATLIENDNFSEEYLPDIDIITCKGLKKKIEALQHEYDLTKKRLVDSYFYLNQDYRDSKGNLMATYKSQIRQQFNNAGFKKDHPSMFDDYSDLKEIKVLLLK